MVGLKDIKPQNIMLLNRDQDVIKLIDFGLARELSPFMKVQANICGTMGFIAPEVLNCRDATPATDFFSLGVVIFMLLSGGHEPFWFKVIIIWQVQEFKFSWIQLSVLLQKNWMKKNTWNFTLAARFPS